MRNEEVLHRVKEGRNVLHAINRRKGNWIGHRLRRNCLLQYVVERNLERRKDVTKTRKRT